jgi:hypothetical protein
MQVQIRSELRANFNHDRFDHIGLSNAAKDLRVFKLPLF